MNELFVGKSLPRVDKEKVTGRAAFINDIKLPRMLYGKVLSSGRAHARIKHIDVSKAEALPGVRAVLTGFNTPEARVGFLGDQTPLKKDKVRQYRDEVAAVAAIDEDIAEEAVSLIKVEYEDLPRSSIPSLPWGRTRPWSTNSTHGANPAETTCSPFRGSSTRATWTKPGKHQPTW